MFNESKLATESDRIESTARILCPRALLQVYWSFLSSDKARAVSSSFSLLLRILDEC